MEGCWDNFDFTRLPERLLFHRYLDRSSRAVEQRLNVENRCVAPKISGTPMNIRLEILDVEGLAGCTRPFLRLSRAAVTAKDARIGWAKDKL